MLRALVLPLVLLGCPGDPPADTGVDVGDPDARWEYEGEVAEPEWTADDVGTALQNAVEQPFPVPAVLFNTFTQVLANGDARCPGPETTFEQILGCTADSGWFYAGIAGYDATDLPEGDSPFIQDDLYADLQVLAPTGERFAIGGSANQHLAQVGGRPSYSGFLQGIFIYTDGSLFDPAVDALIDFEAGERSDGARWAGLDGALGFGDQTLKFDAMVYGAESCPDDITGSVRIRDTTNHWYTVDFGDDCDGCGEVYFNGTEDLGTACVDFTQLGNNLTMSLLEAWR